MDELASMQLPHCRLVDLTGCKIKAGEVFICGEARHLGVVGNGPHLAFRDFSLEQLRQHWRCGFKRWRPLGDRIIDRICHAVELEAVQHDDDGGSGWVMTPPFHDARAFGATRFSPVRLRPS